MTNAHRQVAADAVVARCLKERAPHVGLTRHGALQLKHSDCDGEVDRWTLAAKKRKAGRIGKEMGPWCDMDQTGRAKLPQEHNQHAPCAWNQAGNQKHVAQSQQSPRVGGPGQLLSRDCRPHTRALRPPCLPAGVQRFCPAEPSSRICSDRVTNALGADRACKRALRRYRQTCCRKC